MLEALARWFGTPSPAPAGRWLKALRDEAATVALDRAEGARLAAFLGATEVRMSFRV